MSPFGDIRSLPGGRFLATSAVNVLSKIYANASRLFFIILFSHPGLLYQLVPTWLGVLI